MNSKKKILIQIITNFILAIGIGFSFFVTDYFFKNHIFYNEEIDLMGKVKWYSELFLNEMLCKEKVVNRFENSIRATELFVKSNKELRIELRPLYEGGDYFILNKDGIIIETSSKQNSDELLTNFIEEYNKGSKIPNGLRFMENKSGVNYLLAYSQPKLATNMFILKVPEESLLIEYNLIKKRIILISILIYIFLSILNFISIKLLV